MAYDFNAAKSEICTGSGFDCSYLSPKQTHDLGAAVD